ncbi:cell division protein FtsB [Methylococcus sp. EFPC2]|uniref:cell division protein FtsB n=1 Tax=Methylococcus sp. EFPC2 TaxID=2812648 RepID=UPI0019681E99|nr:cell division protein FtsB [Methylococcus sp. EFPC2]QSA95871.1 cell division protein FtsB [Methylococcus sp. EFPC2]
MNKLTAFLVLLIGLLQFRLWFGDGNLLEFHRLNERIEDLRQEGDKRRERNAALEAEVMDLKQGLDAVEERARQDLGMIKEGEVFVQVIDAHHEAATPPPAPPEAEAKPDENKPKRQRARRARSARAERPIPEVEPKLVEPAEAPVEQATEPSESTEPVEPAVDSETE